MGLCLGKTTTTALPRWLDLPPEIAGNTVRLPTHDDRLNFNTVCHQWHLAARQQGPLLPPAVPCINLGRNGVYQSIVTDDDNGTKVHRRRFATPKGFRVDTTFGSWVLYENRRSHRFFLCDPSSPSTPAIEVPCNYIRIVIHSDTVYLYENLLFAVRKIIVCSPHLVAALTSYNIVIDASVNFACFRPETTVVLWTRDCSYTDIAFHRGKIFAIDSNGHLHSHWLVGEVQSSPANPRDFFSRGEAPPQSRTEHVIKEGPAILAVATQNYQQLPTSHIIRQAKAIDGVVEHPSPDERHRG
ncbi:hypothetical protein ACQ4PT_047170 [Festuca glaucescens]